MKTFYIFYLLICIFSTSICAQSFEHTVNVTQDIKYLLPEGNLDFEIMNGVSTSNRSEKIIKKVTKALAENKEWFSQQMTTAIKKDGSPVPYDKRMGITKEEYDYLTTKKFDIEISSTGEISFDVSYSESKIHIKPSDTIDFKSIIIDFKSKTASIDTKLLYFDGPVVIDSNENVFNSSWKGYKWINEELNTPEIDLENLENMVVKVYNLTIGFIDSSKQLYIDIKGGEYHKGERTVDFKYRLLSK